MKLYFAGTFSVWKRERITANLKAMEVENKLYSYFHESSLAAEWDRCLLLDSGAFSAFTTGATIAIDEFLQFVSTRNPNNAIQLDVIGDEQATWDNWQYGEAKGVHTLPVIHYKASIAHIRRVAAACDYFCLGALVPLSRKKAELKRWLDYIFSIKELRGKKIHCLGIMSKWVLDRYPFYSADSSSVLSVVRYPLQDLMQKMHQKEKSNEILLTAEIKKQLALEKYITALWSKRGITWTD